MVSIEDARRRANGARIPPHNIEAEASVLGASMLRLLLALFPQHPLAGDSLLRLRKKQGTHRLAGQDYPWRPAVKAQWA